MSAALQWAVDTFGTIAFDPQERALRFIEEAIELVDAIGLPQVAVESIARRVYDRPQGVPQKEFGQAMLTLELLAEVFYIDAREESANEFKRVQTISQEEWGRRHRAKVALGIAHLSQDQSNTGRSPGPIESNPQHQRRSVSMEGETQEQTQTTSGEQQEQQTGTTGAESSAAGETKTEETKTE